MTGVCPKRSRDECSEALKTQHDENCTGCGAKLVIIGIEGGLKIEFTDGDEMHHGNGVILSSIETKNDVLRYRTFLDEFEGFAVNIYPLMHIRKITIDNRPRPYHE